jgi:GT2 family glycosyltransferase
MTVQMFPTLSIVIVTWNGKQYALECLDSLHTLNSSLSMEIIVIDNASTDGTPEAIREKFPDVTLVQNESNLGFARANNIGIELSRGEYVCLLNSDVIIPPACLEKMINHMQANKDIGLLGPKMRSPDRSIGQSVMRLPTVWNTLCAALGLHSVFPRSNTFGGFLMNGYPYDKTEDVEVLTGWFWVTSRAALDQVGNLDERFFMYGEDIDWCYRFKQAGWRVVFYSEAQALHYGAASSGQAPTRFYVEMRRANLQYFRKHHSRPRSFGYLVATWLHEVVRVIGYAAVFCFNRCKRADAAFKVDRSLSCIQWLAGNDTITGAS